jgi:NAD+ synthase
MDLSITLAQLNPIVGDIAGNCTKIRDVWEQAESTDLIVFSELIVSGYPPEDLLLKPSFISAVREAVYDLIEESNHHAPALLISAPWDIDGALYNAALLIEHGQLIAVRAKHHLPNYGVFDEKRLFVAGPLPDPVTFRGLQLGVMICEDMWNTDVSSHLKSRGAEILICLNASPFEIDKRAQRLAKAKACALETGLAFIYVNQVGGQDELVFDGGSFVMNTDGEIVQQLAWFEECADEMGAPSCEGLDDEAYLYNALVTGLGDYVDKNGFKGVLLGLSGGIDSALSAAIAVDALGADRVRCVMMPSRYTSKDSLDDASILARNLGVRLETISIEGAVKAFHGILPADGGDIMFQNIQSRTRGLILMALSNASGYMVLSTGNKSEMAVGYATLYGDMCGGFNALKDLYKGQVYSLSRWRDDVIPERIITKAPTAELKANQTDQDNLPEYDVLDHILQCLIEHDMSVQDIIALGHDADDVERVARMLHGVEYKRRQSSPGVKVTSRAFGRDRRYPITHKFCD